MGVLYLPCEIFHREFDAKLLLGLYLYKEYKHDSIIGYDKYFGEILKELNLEYYLIRAVPLLCGRAELNTLSREEVMQ